MLGLRALLPFHLCSLGSALLKLGEKRSNGMHMEKTLFPKFYVQLTKFFSVSKTQNLNISPISDLTCGLPRLCMGLAVATVICSWYLPLGPNIQRQ